MGEALGKVDTFPLPEFCTACGRPPDTSGCPVSHDATPASEDIGIGRLVTYKRALRRRTAVVVAQNSDGFVGIETTGRVEQVPSKAEDAAESEALLEIPSPLYRIESLADTPRWNGVLSDWLSESRDDLLSTIGNRRSFALSALGGGNLAMAEKSGLPRSELTWLAMHTHRAAGNLKSAYGAALGLEADAYPDHPLVLIEAVSAHRELIDDPALLDRVERLSHSVPGRATLGLAIGAAFEGNSSAAAAELYQMGATKAASDIQSVAAGTDSVSASVWSRAATEAFLLPTDLDKISAEFPSIADDLIDAGRVDSSSAAEIESEYLRVRTNINGASADELRSYDAVGELARRAYVSGDRAALETLVEESPSAAGYYGALLTLRFGEIPEDMPEQDTLKAVAASIRSGRAHPNALNDPSTWSVLSHLIDDEVAGNYPDQAAHWQLERASEDLATWQFESALDRARSALKWSADEAIRDEALNIVGFVLYQQENDEPAISALEKALEGEYSANLQANIGIIAADLQPEIAAHHLGRLAEEAPTVDLRLAAVRHAYGIWTTSADAWDEDALVLPENLLSTFRTLVVADIPYDDYVQLVQLLSRADGAWLADSTNTRSGPHASSAARRVYQGRASDDLSDYVDALAEVSKKGNEEEWFVEERTRLVESLRSAIFSEGDSIGPASYAFAVINAGLELDDFDYVTLACGAAMSILGKIAEDDALPSDKVTSMVVNAHKRSELLDQQQRELVEPLVSRVGNQHGAVVADFHGRMHDELVDAVQNVAAQVYGIPRNRIRWAVVVDAVQPMKQQATESAEEVARALAFVSRDDLREFMTGLITSLRGIATRLRNPERNL